VGEGRAKEGQWKLPGVGTWIPAFHGNGGEDVGIAGRDMNGK